MRINRNPNDFLPNPVRSQPNYELFQIIMDHLHIENCIISIGSDKVVLSESLKDRKDFQHVEQQLDAITFPFPILEYVEPIYSTPFTISAMPYQLQYQVISSKELHDFHLPYFNKFIPDAKYFSQVDHIYKVNPIIHPSSPSVKVWVLPYIINNAPQVHVNCEITSTSVKTTATWES